MEWAGHVARMGDRRGVYRVLMGNSDGKRPLGRPRRRWEENNNKMSLQELGWRGMEWKISSCFGHLFFRSFPAGLDFSLSEVPLLVWTSLFPEGLLQVWTPLFPKISSWFGHLFFRNFPAGLGVSFSEDLLLV